jgi:viroplasmin and RNaseH domain-containing protein
MSFNNDYYLLTSITLASLLENASNTTFIHIHIIAVDNFIYPTMKKLNSLKYKINNNCEFIFYNGKEAQDDFGFHTKKEEQKTRLTGDKGNLSKNKPVIIHSNSTKKLKPFLNKVALSKYPL